MSIPAVWSWAGWEAGTVVSWVLVQTVSVDVYGEADVVVRAGIHVALTLLVGAVVIGMLPGYSRRVVSTARRSPIITTVVGLPSAAVLAVLVAIGHVISGTGVGVFFAIPLVSVGFTLLPPLTALGFTAIGATIGNRVGVESLIVWLLLGGLCSGLVAVSPEVTILGAAIATVLGTGAGVRVAMDTGLVNEPEERPTPPSKNV